MHWGNSSTDPQVQQNKNPDVVKCTEHFRLHMGRIIMLPYVLIFLNLARGKLAQ